MMDVLAHKSKKSALISIGCFFLGVALVVACFWFYKRIWNGHFPRRRLRRRGGYIFAFGIILTIASFLSMLEYLRQPQILVEYDDCGIYIYKYRKSEPILVRYENIYSVGISVGVGVDDMEVMDLGETQKGFVPKTRPGHVKIRLNNHEVINIRHVQNAKQVQIELNKKVLEKRRQRREMCEELAEL
jgi:hypothetical protein